MKPAPPETADILHRVRQQVILAQVRIMELEDIRDELAPKLAETKKLLAAAQTLADGKTEESAHLTRTLSDLQAQYDHLRHMQHVTNEALNDTRRQLAATSARLDRAEQAGTRLQSEITALAERAGQLDATIVRLNRELAETLAASAARLERVNQLDQEIRAMKASRSWRWTAWLRSLERAFSRRKS